MKLYSTSTHKNATFHLWTVGSFMELSCGMSIAGPPFFVVEFPKVLVPRMKGIPVEDP
jgi:hypothetical protein